MNSREQEMPGVKRNTLQGSVAASFTAAHRLKLTGLYFNNCS